MKSKNKSKEKKISLKNYIIALLILIGSILLTLYIFDWYNIRQKEKLMNSYLITTKTLEYSINDANSLKEFLEETPNSYFLYISYTNSSDVYNLEKELKRIIDKYKINDIFYYVNIDKLENTSSDYLGIIKDKIGIKNLDNIPMIIYVNNGQVISENILQSKNNIVFNSKELIRILKDNDFKELK